MIGSPRWSAHTRLANQSPLELSSLIPVQVCATPQYCSTFRYTHFTLYNDNISCFLVTLCVCQWWQEEHTAAQGNRRLISAAWLCRTWLYLAGTGSCATWACMTSSTNECPAITQTRTSPSKSTPAPLPTGFPSQSSTKEDQATLKASKFDR